MADNNTIEIKFSATGDDKVIKAINDLDKSTKELIKTQANLRGEGQKQKKNTEALRENNRKLYSELSITSNISVFTFSVSEKSNILFNACLILAPNCSFFNRESLKNEFLFIFANLKLV